MSRIANRMQGWKRRRTALLTAPLALALVGASHETDEGASHERGEGAAQADVAAMAPSALEPRTQNGVEFLSGGVGDVEQSGLAELKGDYNLWVALTNAEGAYLNDVEVSIENEAGRTLVETTTRGPILLARVEPGRYFLRARSEGRTAERRVIDVPRDGQSRVYVALEK